MKEKFIEFQHEGDTLEAYLAVDSNQSKKLPAIMISHTWRGRSDFECDKARALAALGYVGFAIDLYGKGVIGQNPEESAALMQPFLDDRAKLQNRMIAALEVLSTQEEVDAGNIAAMGYCFGGLCVLDLARTGTQLEGVVSFHGLLQAPGNTDGPGGPQRSPHTPGAVWGRRDLGWNREPEGKRPPHQEPHFRGD